ncbi:MAG: cytochrome D1 domain-containing protein [Acidobacteriota bacterium]
MNNHFKTWFGAFVMTAGLFSISTAHALAGKGNVLVVLNKTDNTASLIDPSSGSVGATVGTGVAPHEVAAHGGRGLAVASNYGTRAQPGATLTVIDLGRQKSLRTIDLGRYRRPHGIQFFRDGHRVAVTAEDNQCLLLVDIDRGVVQKAIRTHQQTSHMVVLGPEEKRAYVANIGSGSVSVLDLTQGTLIKNIPTGGGAEGLDISPQGRELWVGNRAQDTLSIIDTGKLEVVATLKSASFPIRVKFTPDGQRVLVSNARSGEVAVFSVKQRKEIGRIPMKVTAAENESRLLQFGQSPVPIGIVVAPDGETAFVANSNADVVSVIDLGAWEIKDRFRAGKQPDGMAYVEGDSGR